MIRGIMDADVRRALRLAKGYDLDLKRTDNGWSATLHRRFLGMVLVGEKFSGSGRTPEMAVHSAFIKRSRTTR